MNPFGVTAYFTQSGWNAHFLLVAMGVCLVIGGLSLVAFRRRRREATLRCRVVTKEELAALYDYCISKFGDQISDLNSMRLWHEQNPAIFEILTNAAPGSAHLTDIEGYFSVLPLTDEGLNGVNKGIYAGATLPPEVLTTDDLGSAIYIGGVVANSQAGRLKVMHCLMARIQLFQSARDRKSVV